MSHTATTRISISTVGFHSLRTNLYLSRRNQRHSMQCHPYLCLHAFIYFLSRENWSWTQYSVFHWNTEWYASVGKEISFTPNVPSHLSVIICFPDNFAQSVTLSNFFYKDQRILRGNLKGIKREANVLLHFSITICPPDIFAQPVTFFNLIVLQR